MAAALIRFFHELRRRRVLGVVIAYIVLGWPMMEAAAFLEETFELPDWFDRLVALLIFLGFPLTVVLAWVFDITPRGIQVTDLNTPQAAAPTSTAMPSASVPTPPIIDSALASVCVLPFDDLSDDAGHDGLAEGLATEIHSTLSRMHRVRVASRRSALRFRDSDAAVPEIAAALNVRYVLSGSLIRVDNRIKVIAELDDGETGSQIWSDKYERQLDDILQVQAEISEAIVATFGAERQRDEIVHAHRKPTESLDAWSLVQRARHYILDYNERSLDEAHKLLKKSLEVDPDYAAALAALGSVLCERVINGFSDDIEAERLEACACLNRAEELLPHDPFVLKMAGMVSAQCGDVDKSLLALRRCVDIAPYDFGAWGYFGWPLAARGTPDDLKELQRIIGHLLENAPDHPGVGYWYYHKSTASLCEGDLEAAELYIRRALNKHPEVSWAWMHLASILGAQERRDEAREAAAKARNINPAMTPQHFADCLEAMSRAHDTTRLRTAGLQAASLLDV